ncbi:MAG: FtsX-like permease family protein [Candidatus Brocadiia bacterium]
MNAATLLRRSLRFYWRTHLGVVLGAAVASAVLVGALVVGDSIRYTLRQLALARLGRTHLALVSERRFFRDALAAELEEPLEAPAAPLLHVRGVARNSDGTARANNVQVLGVDRRFWALGGSDDLLAGAPEGAVVLNRRLARQLGVGEGDEVLLRLRKPSWLSRDAVLSTAQGSSLAPRLTVAAVAGQEAFGRYSLRANQITPYNAYVPLAWLQERVGLAGRANTLVVGETKLGAERAADVLRQHWRLADLGLELRRLEDRGVLELRSEGVFFDATLSEAIEKALPRGLGVFATLVEELRVGDRAVPYPIVAAVERPAQGAQPPPPGGLIPPDTGDDEMLVNSWLAEKDLGLSEDQKRGGATVEMSYFVVGSGRELSTRRETFRLRRVVTLDGPARDPELMPDFPGIADVANCRDWPDDVGIDTSRIEPGGKVQQYWNRYRGTPKAFITLRAGQRLWTSRFGDLTAVRFHLEEGAEQRVASALRRSVDPVSAGLVFHDVRAQALAATTEALDFGQLFIGLSFFLIVAAVLLMALLFVFGVEQRTEEVGTLLSLGFRPRGVRVLMLAEGGALALAGAALGALAGTLYTRGVLAALASVWSGAIANAPVRYRAEASTLVLGAGGAFAVALVAMWLVLRKQARRPAQELLAATGAVGAEDVGGGRRVSLWLGAGAVVAAVAIVVLVGARQDKAAVAAFFSAGGLLLVGGMALTHGLLSHVAARPATARPSLGGMGWRNAVRRRGRSLAVVGLLACGSFLVIAVGANRRNPQAKGAEATPGTGGFQLMAASALPVYHDLDSPSGREAYALGEEEMAGVEVVPLRVREGDDASCLNLNRAQRPRLLGVRPEALGRRGAFQFVATLEGAPADQPWQVLARDAGEDVVPAVGDQATVTWGLSKSVGDTVAYTDGRGRNFQVRIVGVIASSVLQGNLLIGEEAFTERFPGEEGYRMFLVDVPAARREAVAERLTEALADVGLEVVPAERRLAELNAVQNTYLSIFQALGGLGMVLGSVGLGVVVLRNVLERRSELALLRAVGFRRGALQWFVLAEHWGLVALGLGCGVVSAVVAVVPALRSPGVEVPYLSLGLMVAAVVVSGMVWTWLAALVALRGPLLSALRNE